MATPKPVKTLLIVDDDRLFCDAVSESFKGRPVKVVSAHTGARGLGVCSERNVDVVLLDQKLPDANGVDLCSEILIRNDATKIIFITAYSSFDNAVKAIRVGAHDYLSKPFELEELHLAVDKALKTLDLERVAQVQQYKSDIENRQTVLIGGGSGLGEVRRLVDLAAATTPSVLITGETGTGKGLVAKSIHLKGSTPQSAFISINCAAIPESLMEAELFGYVKGAFTGATAERKGIFEMAEGGTLFLDEIGELPLHLQSKLLGVLDDKRVKRLGAESLRPVNVRIIAATSLDIEQAVAEKKFREDLYYRLSVIRIVMPPLRKRVEDIPALCRFFIEKIAPDTKISVPHDEMERLKQYHWPGNVRELANIIERAVILRQSDLLRPSGLIETRPGGFPRETFACESGGIFPAESLTTLKFMEKEYIRHALERLAGNHTRTAKALGISRSTLMRKIETYRLE